MQKASSSIRHLSNTWDRIRKFIRRSPAPHTWTMQNGLHVCANCSYTFAGNFCPRCGQSQYDGNRLTIRLTLKRAFDVWGLGNRSMPRTLLHLLYRPGFMIHDYLKGRRQAYFPPFKMLFLLTALYATISFYIPQQKVEQQNRQSVTTIINAQNADSTKEGEIVQTFLSQGFEYFHVFQQLCTEHRAPILILFHSLFAISAFLLFRRSPSIPHLSASEHFFAQIFISCQLLALSIILTLIFWEKSEYLLYSIPNFGIFLIFCYDYQQLYGYSLLRTIWKTVLSFLFTFFVLVAIFTAIACYLLTEAINSTSI